jgi:hypothetical protein
MNKSIMSELAKVEKIVEGFAAQRKPEENKLTTLMPPGVEMTYSHSDAGHNTSGEIVRFCTSDHPNVAGYHLGWRETVPTHGPRSGEPRRREWVAHKDMAYLERLAKRRASKFPAWCKAAHQKQLDRKAGRIAAASSPTNVPKANKPKEKKPNVVRKVQGTKGKTKAAGLGVVAKAKAAKAKGGKK